MSMYMQCMMSLVGGLIRSLGLSQYKLSKHKYKNESNLLSWGRAEMRRAIWRMESFISNLLKDKLRPAPASATRVCDRRLRPEC